MIGALLMGFAAGLVAGMLGVGGGILFVPALTIFFNFGQVHAEATSLLAIIPVAIVGAGRQYAHGNVRIREGLFLGALGAAGAVGGVALANVVPERWLEIGFAVLVLAVAVQLVRNAMTGEDH